MKAIDKFRFEYNAGLTKSQVMSALDAAPVLPVSASAFSERLAGENLRLFLDNGAVIEYEFSKQGEILLKENGAQYTVPAAVKALGDIVLLAVRRPGTLNYILTVVDLKSKCATVFDAWFGGDDFPAREVLRNYHFGYLDNGGKAPEGRHAVTRRMTGKAVLWEDDTGVKLETIYANHLYSTYLEVGTPSAGDTFSVPSDYIALNARHVIYSRVEVEFSGALVLDVIDLFEMKSIGVRLGLDENDKLDYRMYSAKGTYLGQLAAYGPFVPQPDDAYQLKSGSGEIPAPEVLPPGFRPAYRPFSTLRHVTLEEIDKICNTAKRWVGGFRGPTNADSEMMLPCTELLAGRSLTLRFDDGRVLDYDFIDKHSMRFKMVGGGWVDERYEAFEADTNLVMVAHALPGTPFHAMTLTLDLREGLVTWLDAYHGNKEHPREPIREVRFGVIEGEGIAPPKYKRHGFTNELVGHAYTWEYTHSTTSQHIYSSPWSYSWSIMTPNGMPGVTWSSPCCYIKIREGIYMLSWIEERSQGGCSTYLFNTKTMHDCGTCFGISFENEFMFNTFGAEARNAGKLDLSSIYGSCGHA